MRAIIGFVNVEPLGIVIPITEDLPAADLKTAEVQHNHAAHQKAEVWIRDCQECQRDQSAWFSQASIAEKVRWWMMGPVEVPPNCAACLGENKP